MPPHWGEAEGGEPAAARRVPPAARLVPPRGTNPAEKDPGVTKAEAAGAEPWTAKAEEAEVEPGTGKVLEAEAKSGTEKFQVTKPGGGPMTWAAASVACCATATACALQRRS